MQPLFKRLQQTGLGKINIPHRLCQTGLHVKGFELDSIANTVPLSNTLQAANMHPVSLYYHNRIGFMQLVIKHRRQFYWISHYV